MQHRGGPKRGRGRSWGKYAFIGLVAEPGRLLERGLADEDIARRLIQIATQYPVRTKVELARWGRGAGRIRLDVLSESVGYVRRQLRLELRQFGRDWHQYGRRLAVLELAGELAGGLDPAIVGEHEWREGGRRYE